MKKLRVLTISAILVSTIIFAGCGDNDDRKEEELENRIERLEREVESLKEKNTGNTEASSVPGNEITDSIDSLTKAVDEITKKADSAVPSDNMDERRTQFYDIKDEMDIVDYRIDKYDDYIEDLYKQGKSSYDDYKAQERTLDELEDKLDASEDKLEFNFGIDD